MTVTASNHVRRISLVVAAITVAGGLLTGCATNSGGGTTKGGSASDSGNAYTACLRDKGYDVADPGSGSSTVEKPKGVDEAQFDRDADACAKKTQQQGAGKPAEQAPGATEADRKIGECLRSKGFEDYPDDPDEFADYKPSDEHAFETASKQCESEFGIGGGETLGG